MKICREDKEEGERSAAGMGTALKMARIDRWKLGTCRSGDKFASIDRVSTRTIYIYTRVCAGEGLKEKKRRNCLGQDRKVGADVKHGVI